MLIKIDYLEEMDKFLEMYSLPSLNQDEIKNMNRPITDSDIESVIKKNSQQTKVQDQIPSQVNITKHLEKT